MDWSKVKVREINPPRRRAELFAYVPLAWAAKAAIATNTGKAIVWLWLIQQARKTGSDLVEVSNEALSEYGVTRKVKYRALSQLEAAGLITVKHRTPKAPLIGLLPP